MVDKIQVCWEERVENIVHFFVNEWTKMGNIIYSEKSGLGIILLIHEFFLYI